MPKILTRLKITEVSAVDRGAGENVKIVLMKRDDSGPTDDWIREQREISERMNREHVAKADRSFYGILAKERARPHTHKKDNNTMTSPGEYAASVAKEYGVTPLCKHMAESGKSFGLSEAEITRLITEEAQAVFPQLSAAAAFAQYTEGDRGRLIWKAIDVAKSAPFAGMVLDYMPHAVSPAAWQPQVVADGHDPADEAEALAELTRLGREKWPSATALEQFERALTDPANRELTARAYSRPTAPAGGVYAYPTTAAYTKSAAPTVDSAYAELMHKAEEYRNAHPELSVAQCFEKIYTDRANVELAKRERVESAPR
jgi:hypothetical protein